MLKKISCTRAPIIWLLTIALLVLASPTLADESDSVFDKQVAPLLVQRCLDCHNASQQEGGLNLSRAVAAEAGGESGRVIEPGEPQESLLWQRVVSDEMPPEKALSTSEKAVLQKWIADGAKWGTDPIDP